MGKLFSGKQLSIQQRLPLFICILLLVIIVTFSWISYLGVRNASLKMGGERLTTLVEKLSSILHESVVRMIKNSERIGEQQDIRQLMTTGNSVSRKNAAAYLKTFRQEDTSCTYIQILDKNKINVLQSGDAKISTKLSAAQLLNGSAPNGKFPVVGNMMLYNKMLHFPIVMAAIDEKGPIGYVIIWHFMNNSQKGVDQLTQLLGGDGKLYLGNDDGRFWTNLIKPVFNPPVSLEQLKSVAHYERQADQELIASARSIPGSRWLILIELSSDAIVATAQLFLHWVIVCGLILVVVGSIVVWIMTRRITAPLNELNAAASAIAAGNYDAEVNVKSNDELGKLAESFNIMAAHVRSAQKGLERKVEDRTRLLETAITDIFDQKQNEKRKDEFISIASHELKTPLTTIKAFFQLATRDIHPELKSYRFIDKASRQLSRMERLIEDLLDVSKINSGKMQYDLEHFDFEVALIDAVDSVQEISSSHQLLIMKSEPLIYYGDRHRIEQVVINLLNNAVKYSPTATTVYIYAEIEGDNLAVTVKDAGIGIAEEHLNALFDRFYRVDTEHRFQGLGLGLFISSEIIKRHGGCIRVESQPGAGAAFTFELPLHMEAIV